MTTRITVVIPARMASSRFPGKPLVNIGGLPMVEHVRRRALLARGVSDVVVATCDQSIVDAITALGGRAVMTADTHQRCTDRVVEAMQSLPGDVVVIVQGDEPLLMPAAVEAVAAPLTQRAEVVCTNLLSPMESDADLTNTDIVKAACAQDGRLMFLSRSPIPSYRTRVVCPIYRQTGIMAFTRDLLARYSQLPETPFEQAESVDMLRLLEHGVAIHGVVAAYPTVGVDRPGDVPAVERWLQDSVDQRVIYEDTMRMA